MYKNQQYFYILASKMWNLNLLKKSTTDLQQYKNIKNFISLTRVQDPMLKNTKHREKRLAYGSEDNIKMVIFSNSNFQKTTRI